MGAGGHGAGDVDTGPAWFTTTHWSVVLTAGDSASSLADEALEKLCRTYWYPLYVYLRRRGYAVEDAQDFTQGFLCQLLGRHAFARVDPAKGKFRSFLLAGLNYFLADQHDRATAQKRGGGRMILSFDAQTAEERYRLEPVDDFSPDKAFDRQWALTVLNQVLARLEQEFCEKDKGELFQHLQRFLVAGMDEERYADVAQEVGMTTEAFKKAVQRLRHRYYELFREEIAQTLADPAGVEDELRHLCAVISA